MKIHTHIQTHTYIQTSTHTHAFRHLLTYTHIQTHICTRTRTQVQLNTLRERGNHRACHGATILPGQLVRDRSIRFSFRRTLFHIINLAVGSCSLYMCTSCQGAVGGCALCGAMEAAAMSEILGRSRVGSDGVG